MLDAVVFVLLEEVISSYTPHWNIIFGPLLVLSVLFVRRGLYGPFGAARQSTTAPLPVRSRRKAVPSVTRLPQRHFPGYLAVSLL
jgi:branched-chain amino acid transport system permease protein